MVVGGEPGVKYAQNILIYMINTPVKEQLTVEYAVTTSKNVSYPHRKVEIDFYKTGYTKG